MTRISIWKGYTSAWSEPVPSCPNWFPPNAYTSPPLEMQTVCHNPAATASIWTVSNEDTQVGLNTSSVPPCPHCNTSQSSFIKSLSWEVIIHSTDARRKNTELTSKKDSSDPLLEWASSWTSTLLFLHHFYFTYISIPESSRCKGE